MSKRIKKRYITQDQFDRVLEDFNMAKNLSDNGKDDIYEEALGNFESDMAERFVVPLVSKSGADIEDTKDYTRLMVQNAIKAKIRQSIGQNESKNVVVEKNERFIDIHAQKYNGLKKSLLNHKIPFDLKLQDHAEGAVTPIQTVGIARADNGPVPEFVGFGDF